MMAYFLGLPKEYLSLLFQLERALGTYLEMHILAASIVSKAIGLLLVQVLILDPTKLPS